MSQELKKEKSQHLISQEKMKEIFTEEEYQKIVMHGIFGKQRRSADTYDVASSLVPYLRDMS